MRKLPEEPLTIRVLRVLYRAKAPLTRAELMRRAGVHPATEITRPLRDLRKRHVAWGKNLGHQADSALCGRLTVPCTDDAAGRPAYWLTSSDRASAAIILGVKS